MDCLKATSMIRRFISDDLKRREYKEFVRHIQSCKECYDETEVLLLVEKADTAFFADQVQSYDFSDLLKKKIESFEKETFRRRILSGVILTGVLLITIL
ncbi:MAG: hypothetical protein IKY02_03920, partial [Lachnospiraceae bacterium]|nr:hypothetical protein [Lachnospiraceae bacterium]